MRRVRSSARVRNTGRSDAIRGEKRSRDASTKKHRSSRSSGRVRPRVGFGIRRLKRLGNAPVWPARRSRAMPCAPSRTSWRTRGTGTAGSPAGRTLRVGEVGRPSARETFDREISDLAEGNLLRSASLVGDVPACSQCSPSPGSSMPTRVALFARAPRASLCVPRPRANSVKLVSRNVSHREVRRSAQFEKFAKPPTVLFCNRRK